MGVWQRVSAWIAPSRRQFSYTPVADVLSLLAAQTSGTTIGRSEALSVPAVQRGRNMLCSISTLPLIQLNAQNVKQDNPLLRQFDPDVPNVVHLAQTVEDMVFYGIGWWEVTSRDFDGFPMSVRHRDAMSVSLQSPANGRTPAPLPSGYDPRGAVVYVDGRPVPASEMIRFDSPNPAVLKTGGRAIRRALLLDQLAAMYADNPRPQDYFSPGDGADEIDDAEILAILAKWQAARKQRATAYVPEALKYETVDSPSPADLQLVELQKQVALELANLFGVDPEDLGVSTTSRTYQNDVDRRRNKVNEVLAPYMRAVEHRLSMGDVTRRGHRVVFDLDDYLKSNPTERAAVQEKYLNMGVLTPEEIRAEEGLPPLPPDAQGQEPAVPVGPPATDVPAQSSGWPRVTFAAKPIHFDAEVTGFSVDSESRTITGVLMPYGTWGSNGGVRYRFAKGALKFSDASRVKLLRDHDITKAIGYAKGFKDTPQGLVATFKVSRGAAGDEALALAADGVLDGLSAGVEFDPRTDVAPDPKDRTAFLVTSAALREGSLTAMPAFDDARLTSVQASAATEGIQMTDTTEPVTPAVAETPATVPVPATFTAEQVTTMMAFLSGLNPNQGAGIAPERPTVVDPTRPTAATFVREALPYRFQRQGVFAPFQPGDNVFSQDLHTMAQAGDIYGNVTDAGKRVMGLLNATFTRREFVISTDIDELNPAIQRPDLYVDQRDYRYPIYASIDRGAPPNGVNPFTFPKFSSSGSLVGDHTEGTEPGAGTFVTTSQTITPTPLSGKVRITREVWDMGGNPAVSTLIFNQMVRGYREGLESAAATFLNTLTAATDINLGVAATDAAFTAAWEAAVAGLQFVRGYDFSTFVVDQTTYLKAVGARTTDGRAYYPQITPTNANGQSEPRFAQLNMAGVIALPSWALPSVAGSPNNSWLYDPAVVWGFSTPPQRLEFPGSGAANIYTPVAGVDLAIWGYKAFANTDIAGVRQVIYDSV